MRCLYLLLLIAFSTVANAQNDSTTKELQSDLVFLKSEVYQLRSNLAKLEKNLHLASQYTLARNISAGISTGSIVMVFSDKLTLQAMKAFVVVAGVSSGVALILGVKAYLILHKLHTEEYGLE